MRHETVLRMTLMVVAAVVARLAVLMIEQHQTNSHRTENKQTNDLFLIILMKNKSRCRFEAKI